MNRAKNLSIISVSRTTNSNTKGALKCSMVSTYIKVGIFCFKEL